METVCVNLYSFAELSSTAQATAIANDRKSREEADTFSWEVGEAANIVKAAAEVFGFKLVNWSIGADVQSSFVDLRQLDVTAAELTGVRLRTWLINNHYDVFYTKKPYGEYRDRASGMSAESNYRYDRYSKIQFIETDCPFTGMFYDCEFLDTFREFLAKPSPDTLESLFEAAVENLCRALEREYEYQMSDESIRYDLELSDDAIYTEEGELQ